MNGSEITDHMFSYPRGMLPPPPPSKPQRTPKRLRIMDALCEAFERWRQDLDDVAYIARIRRILRDANRKRKGRRVRV